MNKKALLPALGKGAIEAPPSKERHTVAIGLIIGVILVGLTLHKGVSTASTKADMTVSSSTGSEKGSIDVTDATKFLGAYYSVVVDTKQRPVIRQTMLTTSYRQSEPANVYEAFWVNTKSVSVTNVSAGATANAFTADLTYTPIDGQTKPAEHTAFTLACASPAPRCASGDIRIQTEHPVTN